MDVQQKGQNDAMQNKSMSDDPNWSDVERDKYQAAYNAAKRKQQEEQK